MNNSTFVHKYAAPLIDKDDICVDMTAGNGNDTLFLCKRAKKVYAFDISEEAIRKTSQRVEDYDNVVLINDSHVNLDKYVKEKIRLFIFNLGYLPKADSYSVTEAGETLKAFRKAYELLEKDGYIIITFYLGHRGGKDEYYLLKKYFEDNSIIIQESYVQDKPDSPVTVILR
jgi:hypothetical protein